MRGVEREREESLYKPRERNPQKHCPKSRDYHSSNHLFDGWLCIIILHRGQKPFESIWKMCRHQQQHRKCWERTRDGQRGIVLERVITDEQISYVHLIVWMCPFSVLLNTLGWPQKVALIQIYSLVPWILYWIGIAIVVIISPIPYCLLWFYAITSLALSIFLCRIFFLSLDVWCVCVCVYVVWLMLFAISTSRRFIYTMCIFSASICWILSLRCIFSIHFVNFHLCVWMCFFFQASTPVYAFFPQCRFHVAWWYF